MSDNNSNMMSYLRQYRFQRKPNAPGPSNSVTVIASTSHSQPVIRMAVPNSGNLPVLYKRIRIQDSDSDDAGSPAKKQAVPELTPAIKERRFRNMLEMFPDIPPMMVKNTLVKHGWNEERSRDELLKQDPESDERTMPATTFFGAGRSGLTGQMVRPNGNTSYVRVISGQSSIVNVTNGGIVARKPLTSRTVRVRKGSSGSEDDDYGVKKGKDDRVYDSDDSDNEITDDLVGDKRKVFEFLNTSNMNELSLLSGCSQKKADAIISLRPFKGWLDMVEKFNSNKSLSTELLNSTQELLTTRNNIQRLMKKCVGLAQQLESAVAAGAGRLKQPASLDSSLTLAPYQLVGLNWLAVLHKQGVSGILADEMGLGKTVQVIAFLAHLKETGQARGTHLVVVPASTLDNWSGELSRWCPSLRVSKYYGPPEERRQLRIEYARKLDQYDVVLTTYTMVSSCPEERKMFRITPMHYVVYDEAHMLKNMATQRYDNLLKIKSKHRLLLTGTPLQNNLLELMSLLCFVMPHMFSGKTEDLKSLFQKNAKSKITNKIEGSEDDAPPFEASQITQAKRIMKPFVLRRLKRDVLQDLPRKTNHVHSCPMAARQQQLYKDLIAGFSANDGTIRSTNEQTGMSMMMDMRKLANHPVLLRYHYGPQLVRQIAARLVRSPGYKETNEQYACEDIMWLSDFQIHQLTLQHEVMFLRYHYGPPLVRQIAARLVRSPGYKETNEQYAYEDIMWLSDFQIHQLTLQHEVMFLRYHYGPPLVRQIAARLVRSPGYKETNEQYAYEDIMWLSDFQIHQLTLQHEAGDVLRYHYGPPLVRQIAARLVRSPGYKETNEQYAYEDIMWLSDFQIHQLTLQHECIRSFALPERLILDSGKFLKLDEMLPQLKAEGHRVLLFSQFVMMLDVLEPYLTARNYRYLRLDGSTAVPDRQELIDRYNTEDIFVFLLSTRAGGLGINLTAADTVIIHDIDFNPYNDKQAEDRCHRMGQTRPVAIHRLLSAGTIEEGIYQVAREKLTLEQHVTGADDNDGQEQKNVVRLLSAALGLTSPNK